MSSLRSFGLCFAPRAEDWLLAALFSPCFAHWSETACLTMFLSPVPSGSASPDPGWFCRQPAHTAFTVSRRCWAVPSGCASLPEPTAPAVPAVSPWSGAALCPVEVQSWFLGSSGAEFEIFFPPFLVISEKKAGCFYSTVSY